MNDQIKKMLEPLKHFWSTAPKKVKGIIVGVLIAIIVGALILCAMMNIKEYVTIFSDVSEAETSEIFAALEGTQYDVKASNGNIMVPAKDESAVRMKLAQAGYPKDGLSYYLINENNSMLTTDYERKQYMNMQLQERIAASIESLEGVKSAVVTITPAEENVFYLQEKNEPSASVVVHMEGAKALNDSQIAGILNLVTKSVSGLKRENVALTDGQGNELAGAQTGSSESVKVQLTNEIENQIKKKVTAVLLGPYRQDQFKVSVTAVVDTDKMIREELTYNSSPDGDNSGVISEESSSEESASSSEGSGGVAGTTSNSDVTTYPTGTAGGGSTSTASSEDIKYLVSSIREQTEKAGAYIDAVSIGIAIDKANFDTAERENILELVSYSAGVAPENITVQNFEFYRDAEIKTEVPEEIDKKIIYIGAGAAALLLGVIITVILLLGKKRRKAAEQAALEEAERIKAEQSINNLFGDEVKEIQKLEPMLDARRREIKEFAISNPEIAAQMIRTWLRNEND